MQTKGERNVNDNANESDDKSIKNIKAMKMKKFFISMMFVFSALMMFNGCIVSDKKLANKVQEAIINDEQSNGNTLEVTEFQLDEKGSPKKGVLKGQLNGKEVVYDISVTDEGSEFDVDWELRK